MLLTIIEQHGLKTKMMENLYQEVIEKEKTEGKSLNIKF